MFRTMEIDNVARPFLNRQTTEPQPKTPSFNTSEWWACVISEKLLNYDTLIPKHSTEARAPPKDFDLLPGFHSPKKEGPKEADVQDIFAGMDTALHNDDDESEEPHSGEDQGTGHATVLPLPRKSGAAKLLGTHCGELPHGSQLEDYHAPPLKNHARDAEGRYWRDFAIQARDAFPASAELREVYGTTSETLDINIVDALEAVNRQNELFKSVGKFNIEPESI